MLSLHSPRLSVDIDVALGAEIRAVRSAAGVNALAAYDWGSPTPVGRGASYGDPEQDWLSAYRGGWQETVPNAGQTCVVDGVPMGFHGDASRTEWQVVDATEESCHLRCPSRLPITIERWMRLSADRPVLQIDGRVTNESSRDVDIVWGQHPAFPLVPGGIIDLPPGCTVRHDASRPSDLRPRETSWPQAQTLDGRDVDLSSCPEDGTHRLLYLTGHGEGWAAIRQPEPFVSVALAWDVTVHPFMWLWTLRGTNEFPWYGRASVMALEAQAAWPYDGLAAATARGQAITVPAGQSVSTWYTVALLPEASASVVGVDRDRSVHTTDAKQG